MTNEIPECVNAANVTNWSDEVNVVVMGFGIAGGCAAASTRAPAAAALTRNVYASGWTTQPYSNRKIQDWLDRARENTAPDQ